MNPFVIAFRRIIYSIPLKLLLLLLVVFGILFASFSNAEQIENGMGKYMSVGSYTSYLTFSYANFDLDYTVCIGIDSTSCDFNFNYNSNTIRLIGRGLYCFSGIHFNSNTSNNPYFTNNASTCVTSISVFPTSYFDNSCPTCPEQYTSLECQTEYNLIPISSVDENYCSTNNLCPSSDCPSYSGDLVSGVSNIYINDIFHPGAFNIVMNIPQEIDWDYAYTNSGQNFNIDVVGYNQDFEKIEGWIETNNYKPTSEDFTNIFTSFSSFGGLLIACLFVILVFYFVKKMF